MHPDSLPSAVGDRFGLVSADIASDLERYVELLRRWQATHNLVSRASLEHVWTRHVADSLQLVTHAPEFRTWVDLGSGAGFPGLIVAIAFKARNDHRFVLIESNGKKAAFLKEAVRQTQVNALVVADRIEAYARSRPGSAEVVSARALAPLAVLCGLAAPLLKSPAGVLILLKGKDVEAEAQQASQSWAYDISSAQSITDPDGRVLAIRNLRSKVPA